MSFWTAIVIIVAITSIANIWSSRYKALGRKDKAMQTYAAPQREAELEREVADLKKRLAVLERIATDDRQSKAIANEIEALRDR